MSTIMVAKLANYRSFIKMFCRWKSELNKLINYQSQ